MLWLGRIYLGRREDRVALDRELALIDQRIKDVPDNGKGSLDLVMMIASDREAPEQEGVWVSAFWRRDATIQVRAAVPAPAPPGLVHKLFVAATELAEADLSRRGVTADFAAYRAAVGPTSGGDAVVAGTTMTDSCLLELTGLPEDGDEADLVADALDRLLRRRNQGHVATRESGGGESTVMATVVSLEAARDAIGDVPLPRGTKARLRLPDGEEVTIPT